MRHSSQIPILLIAAGLLVWGGVAAAADIAAGQAKAKEVCAACHGVDGNSASADFPRLGGQYPDYLAKALRDYKSGKRKNPIMAGMAAPLTPRDIDNLAAFYASQSAVLRSEPRK